MVILALKVAVCFKIERLVSVPTSRCNPSFYTYVYDVTHDIFQCFESVRTFGAGLKPVLDKHWAFLDKHNTKEYKHVTKKVKIKLLHLNVYCQNFRQVKGIFPNQSLNTKNKTNLNLFLNTQKQYCQYNTKFGSSVLNPGAVFLHIFLTEAFLLFLAPAVGL